VVFTTLIPATQEEEIQRFQFKASLDKKLSTNKTSVVVHICNPKHTVCIGKGIEVEDQPGKKIQDPK
jgi:hypothetical protein